MKSYAGVVIYNNELADKIIRKDINKGFWNGNLLITGMSKTEYNRNITQNQNHTLFTPMVTYGAEELEENEYEIEKQFAEFVRDKEKEIFTKFKRFRFW